ncbi:uncharacterized protein N7483_002085 [Penicillium malachiteum]|uniref:uncharacterized protein n=1 Tax=Penicillium malachiteum TaxID=1324776 RepID=UPI0025473BD3|nr:uncharacterized protein N7483_002085 [Penicillium malachiteum]KAJ5736960.1 hypothetical protein N7483_002085 [Penicillium malachiteum]
MSHFGPERTKKKRVRHWTAEDRAVHREFEKSRREAFSERLLELTKLLPMLKEEIRPSKHIIVDASIAHHKTQQTKCDQAASTIRKLLAERDELLKEVNSLRALYRPGTSIPRQAVPVDLGVLELLAESDNSNPSILTMLPGKRLDVEKGLKERSNTSQQASLLPATTGTDGSSQGAVYPEQPIETPPFAYSPVEAGWVLDNPSKATTAMSQDLIDASFLWNQSPEIIPSRPKAGDPRHNSRLSTSCLVSDSASFWNMHPGAMLATSPDTNLHYDLGASQWTINVTKPDISNFSFHVAKFRKSVYMKEDSDNFHINQIIKKNSNILHSLLDLRLASLLRSNK